MRTAKGEVNNCLFIFVWLPWFLLLGPKSAAGNDLPCEDFDTSGCLSNPGLCLIPDLSIATCPKTCNKCPFYCYHCDQPVSDVTRCTNVTACAADKRCLYQHVASSIDGHEEFNLKCVEASVCTSKRMEQKRNVQIQCCTGNYCNRMQTTTNPTTSTSTTPVTTKAQGCYKDVIFIAEESLNIGNIEPAKQFMHNVISGLEIGINKTLAALLVNKAQGIVWNLNGHYSKTDLIDAVNQLHPDARPPYPDPLVGLNTYIHHANDVSFGNRHDKADVVILVTTVDAVGGGFLLASFWLSRVPVIAEVHRLSNNVIVFGIGNRF